MTKDEVAFAAQRTQVPHSWTVPAADRRTEYAVLVGTESALLWHSDIRELLAREIE